MLEFFKEWWNGFWAITLPVASLVLGEPDWNLKGVFWGISVGGTTLIIYGLVLSVFSKHTWLLN